MDGILKLYQIVRYQQLHLGNFTQGLNLAHTVISLKTQIRSYGVAGHVVPLQKER